MVAGTNLIEQDGQVTGHLVTRSSLLFAQHADKLRGLTPFWHASIQDNTRAGAGWRRKFLKPKGIRLIGALCPGPKCYLKSGRFEPCPHSRMGLGGKEVGISGNVHPGRGPAGAGTFV